MEATHGRRKALVNLLRMGHCAPTVMQTLLDVSALDKEWLVTLVAGMPGGIGNTGCECGALTSSLALLGLQYGLRESDRGLPVVLNRGHALRRRFLECHKRMICKEIRGRDRFPLHCIRPVLLSPELYAEAAGDDTPGTIPEEVREAYCRLYAHIAGNRFHCARAVFEHLAPTVPDQPEVFDVASGFMRGTLFLGLTCSALAAGVQAIGLASGEIENSPPRVVRLLAIMTVGGNAFDDSLNKFNKSMNRGYQLSKWFRREFGSTQCRAITQCDFSYPSGVSRYIESNCIAQCKEIAGRVAEKVEQMLANQEPLVES